MICQYCGRVDTATKGTMCVDCMRRRNRYKYLKGKLQRHLSNETSEQLQAVINEYRSLRSRGYKVPRDIM